MNYQIPAAAEKYSESPVFTQDTIPDGLRKDHNTKASVWGKIIVFKGTLIYLRDGLPAQRLKSGECGTILPEEPHFVTPDGDVTFKVEFYREPALSAEQ